MHIELEHHPFGTGSSNRLAAADGRGIEGARAALETFYYALNNKDADAMRDVWLGSPLVQLNNPLGGIIRGRDSIVALYQKIFESPADIRVDFSDIVAYANDDTAVFAGREFVRYRSESAEKTIEFRTSRIFAFDANAGGWRQIHHHGSADDAVELGAYRNAVLR